VPASSANLGPGFDALAVALSLYIEVDIKVGQEFELVATGEGSELADDPQEHLGVKIATDLLGHRDFFMAIHSDIPVGRGLGSSAAMSAAVAGAAGTVDPFAIAARQDGHPENAAASVMGGLVAATSIDGEFLARSLPLDPSIAFVVIIPDRSLATSQARSVLPNSVTLRDAASNLGRLGLMIAGLGRLHDLVPEAAGDKLHQPARTALFPEAPSLLAALIDGGARASCWSGAGPSLLGICDRHAGNSVESAAKSALASAGIPGKVLILDPDFRGLTEID